MASSATERIPPATELAICFKIDQEEIPFRGEALRVYKPKGQKIHYLAVEFIAPEKEKIEKLLDYALDRQKS